MPKQKRFKTKYPGVYYIKSKCRDKNSQEKIYYIYYRKNKKIIEEKVGREFEDRMTAAHAAGIRSLKIEGKEVPNRELAKALKAEKSLRDRKPALTESGTALNSVSFLDIGTEADRCRKNIDVKQKRNINKSPDYYLKHSVNTLRENEYLFEEITNLRQLTDSLCKSEERYRNLFNNLNDVFCCTDSRGRIVMASPSFERATGYKLEEILGKDMRDFYEPEDIERYLKRVKRDGFVENFEIPVKKKDGSTAWALISAKLIKDQGDHIIGAIGVSMDITERKLTEIALKEREAELSEKTRNLEEVNTALKVLLKRREEDKTELEEKVLLNMKELIEPYIEKLNNTKLSETQKTYVDIIESNLKDIISPFSRSMSSAFLGLSPMEIQVANLVKVGRSTKEIANLLNLSTKTIDSHRNSLRKKIGIKNRKANLRTYLSSFE